MKISISWIYHIWVEHQTNVKSEDLQRAFVKVLIKQKGSIKNIYFWAPVFICSIALLCNDKELLEETQMKKIINEQHYFSLFQTCARQVAAVASFMD